MSQFLRLMDDKDKEKALFRACHEFRDKGCCPGIFNVNHDSFDVIPGKPFAYWVSEDVRESFEKFSSFEEGGRKAQRALSTNDDFRYLRTWWERDKDVVLARPASGWVPFAKGGEYSPFYLDVYLLVNWIDEGRDIEANVVEKYPYLNGNVEWVLHRECNYLQPGLTWSRRTQGGLSLRVMPAGCIFADKGPAAFVENGDHEELLALLAIANSHAFRLLVSLQMAFGSYEVGVIQKTPVPSLNETQRNRFADLACTAWSLKRTLDTVTETSHAFALPAVLRSRMSGYVPSAIEAELASIQAEIDDIAFDLYGFSTEDRQAALGNIDIKAADEKVGGDEDQTEEAPPLDALLSWTAGAAFGRFDWRLATGERPVPPEPEPFDPLPAKSPGMLPDGAEPYHRHAGILVDDPGHEHDLPRLMADVLEMVESQVDDDLRRWLRRDFFKYHLQQYSKSRRKAPIYWPLATVSGSYTLWLYYPDLTDQTLFTAVNDFVEPKLKQVDSELGNLRLAGTSRSRKDEKRLEELSDFRDELADLRDTLLRIAPDYKPNHDDGVQISAAPLWPLFRHKPWQKVLKETWERLEQGDFDWAHLAMAYWPDRVREKCVNDKSLAIAHDLEHLYVEPEPAPKKARGRKKGV